MNNENLTAILLLSCPDRVGLVSRISHFIFERGGNILDLDEHVDPEEKDFSIRVVWDMTNFSISASELNDAFSRFKDLADKKHEIYDEDLQALVTETNMAAENEVCNLVAVKVCTETGETPEANITLNIAGNEKSAVATGGGPVDATFKAIEKIVNRLHYPLPLYNSSNRLRVKGCLTFFYIPTECTEFLCKL